MFETSTDAGTVSIAATSFFVTIPYTGSDDSGNPQSTFTYAKCDVNTAVVSSGAVALAPNITIQ